MIGEKMQSLLGRMHLNLLQKEHLLLWRLICSGWLGWRFLNSKICSCSAWLHLFRGMIVVDDWDQAPSEETPQQQPHSSSPITMIHPRTIILEEWVVGKTGHRRKVEPMPVRNWINVLISRMLLPFALPRVVDAVLVVNTKSRKKKNPMMLSLLKLLEMMMTSWALAPKRPSLMCENTSIQPLVSLILYLSNPPGSQFKKKLALSGTIMLEKLMNGKSRTRIQRQHRRRKKALINS